MARKYLRYIKTAGTIWTWYVTGPRIIIIGPDKTRYLIDCKSMHRIVPREGFELLDNGEGIVPWQIKQYITRYLMEQP